MHTVEALDRLILFRQKPDSLLRRLMSSEEAVRVAAQGELVALAVENGWQGDLWRCCIARELVSSENPFSLAWERRSGGQDTLEALALADMKLFFELVSAPPEGGAWPLLRNFRHESRRTADCASFLAFSGELAAAGSPEGLLGRLTAFYQTQGVGLLGMGQVFRARRTGNGAELVPVEDRPPVRLADLVGYRQQKGSADPQYGSLSAGERVATTCCSTVTPVPENPPVSRPSSTSTPIRDCGSLSFTRSSMT